MIFLKEIIYDQNKTIRSMQKMITGLEVVIIRQVQRLKDMNGIIKGLKYTIQELQQNAAGKKNDGLETVVMDKERQI